MPDVRLIIMDSHIKYNFTRHYWPKDNTDDCWEWKGNIGSKGYGRFTVRSGGICREYLAHRVSYVLFHNLREFDQCVLHECDNPICVNPWHLFEGTKADNMEDKVMKGRQTKGVMVNTARLTEEEVLEIRDRYAHEITTCQQLAEEYGTIGTAISKIVNRRTWKHI